MRRKVFMLGGVVLLAIAACSGPSHHSTSPTSVPAPPSSAPSTSAPSTVSAPDPYAVPRVITVAYVNSVLAALAHVSSEGARVFAASRQINASVKADLAAAFTGPAYSQQLQDLQQILQQRIVNPIRPGGGDLSIRVRRVVTGTSTCIFVETRSDASALFSKPVPQPASEYFKLLPKQTTADPKHLNPTPWAFADDEAFLRPTSAPTECASESSSS
jgi:hypothetical protein